MSDSTPERTPEDHALIAIVNVLTEGTSRLDASADEVEGVLAEFDKLTLGPEAASAMNLLRILAENVRGRAGAQRHDADALFPKEPPTT